jgi:hypothetical protein
MKYYLDELQPIALALKSQQHYRLTTYQPNGGDHYSVIAARSVMALAAATLILW